MNLLSNLLFNHFIFRFLSIRPVPFIFITFLTLDLFLFKIILLNKLYLLFKYVDICWYPLFIKLILL